MSKVPNRSHSSRAEKKMSVAIRNIDFNLYRAYKNINTNKAGGHNPYEKLHGENNMARFPFGLTEQRFRWQFNPNEGERTELKGKLYRKSSLQTEQREEHKADWATLMKRSSVDPEKKITRNRASSYKYEIESNSKRIVNPHHTTEENYSRIKTKHSNQAHANGSIANLINITPDYTTKKRPLSIQKSNKIFEPFKYDKRENYARMRGAFDNGKLDSGEYYGMKSFPNTSYLETDNQVRY